MSDTDTHESRSKPDPSDAAVETDGGAVSQAAQDHQQTDYLGSEVNLLSPSTLFMRDHLKLVWTTFIAWVLIVWGPVTATYFAPETMTTTMPAVGFPLHYFLVALGAPTGSLVLAAIYARQRDRLDRKYGIDHAAVSLATPEPPMETKWLVRQCHSPEPMGQQQTAEDVVATDGGKTPADD